MHSGCVFQHSNKNETYFVECDMEWPRPMSGRHTAFCRETHGSWAIVRTTNDNNNNNENRVLHTKRRQRLLLVFPKGNRSRRSVRLYRCESMGKCYKQKQMLGWFGLQMRNEWMGYPSACQRFPARHICIGRPRSTDEVLRGRSQAPTLTQTPRATSQSPTMLQNSFEMYTDAFEKTKKIIRIHKCRGEGN